MAIIKNALTYGFGFNVTAAGPVDSRMRVNYLTDLTTVWGTSTDGVFTPNPDAPVYAGMQVIVNEQNKAYILKQQVAEGYTLDDKTQVVKNGLVYNKADDAPIAANPTDINNWVPVGTDFSGDISDLSDRVDDIETDVENLTAKLNVSNTSGLSVDDNNALSVKLVADSEDYLNGLVATEQGLAVASYQLKKRGTNLEDAYAAQYDFIAYTPEGKVVTTINIPKDQFLQNAEFITASEADTAIDATVIVGDPYLKFTWMLDTDPDVSGKQNITYVPVKSLVDTYTGGTYVTINSNNEIDVNLVKLNADLTNTLGIDTLKTNVDGLVATVGNAESGLVADVAKNTADIATNTANIATNTANIETNTKNIDTNTKNIATLTSDLSTLQANVVNDINTDAVNGISLSYDENEDEKKVVKVNVDIDTLASAVIEAANIPDPIASNITVSAFGATYTEETNVQSVLESLDSRIKAAVSGGVTSVVAGVGINVNATDANNPTVSVKTSDLVVSGSALTVTDNKIDLIWQEL